MKRISAILLILLPLAAAYGQNKQESNLKREVTLYNPYKPSLPDVAKKSFLPDMTDTSRVRPDFSYEVKTFPFMPPYVVSPVKAAVMVPDPLPKLYNSFVRLGFGTYLSPLAEVSISNQRSKKGSIGLYARHFSTNGYIDMQTPVFAGYMDNDASLYGRKFFKGSILSGSVDFAQKTRHAYGYDITLGDYDPGKKDIRMNYYDAGASVKLASDRLDSSKLAYDFGLKYNLFSGESNYYEHSVGFKGKAAMEYKGFYVGSGIRFQTYVPSDSVSNDSKYIASVSPFIARSKAEWSVRLGIEAMLDKGYGEETRFHIYPDVYFGFTIVPSYLGFFAEITGRLEQNDPGNVIAVNPYVIAGNTLFNIRNTDYSLVTRAGLKGETGIEGSYTVSASYSVVNDFLMFSNYVHTDGAETFQHGNYFVPLLDEAEILNIHGDISGEITGNISFESGINYYRYTLANNDYAWNRPDWDASLNLKYNLRNKILAGIGMNALGKRTELVTRYDEGIPVTDLQQIPMNAHFSFNISAEYRYTKILSFWLKMNNISGRYYEWAYYPAHRFICLVGFTYSL